MATKPTSTFLWATSLNYTTGPFTGFPTKLTDPLGQAEGSVPGQGVVAEFYNRNMNILGDWTVWLDSGSFSPALDAHIVETNDDGTTAVAAAVLGGTASSDVSLVITENSGAPNQVMDVENTATGFGIISTVNGDLAALRGISSSNTGGAVEALNFGTGRGLIATANSGTAVDANSTIGVAVDATATTGTALKGTVTEGFAGDFIATGNSGTGLRSTVDGGLAGKFEATGTGSGVDIISTTGIALNIDTDSGQGIDILTSSGIILAGQTAGTLGITSSTTNSAGTSVRGIVNNVASGTNSIGVFGWNTGGGVGVKGLSTTYYGIIAETDTTTPARAPLRIVPQDTQPSSLSIGDVFVRDEGSLGWGYGPAGTAKFGWGTQFGWCEAFYRTNGTDINSTNDYANGQYFTVSLDSPNEPRKIGYIEIEVCVLMEIIGVGASADLKFRVYDITAAAPAFEITNWSYDYTNSNEAFLVHQTFRYLIPAAGERQFRFEFATNGGGTTWGAAKGWMRIRGIFDTSGTP